MPPVASWFRILINYSYIIHQPNSQPSCEGQTITNQLCIETTEMVSSISDHKSAINPMEICSFSIFLSVKAPFFRWFGAGGHDKAMTMVVSPRRWGRMSGSWARHVSPSRARERGAVRENGAGFFRRSVTNWLIYVVFFHPGLRPSETWPYYGFLTLYVPGCYLMIFVFSWHLSY